MAGDVEAHADLEEEGVGGVEQRQVDQETHGGAAVGQHVQHRTKLSACQGYRKDNEHQHKHGRQNENMTQIQSGIFI